MEIRVIGDPKEIAALVVAIQERQRDGGSVEDLALDIMPAEWTAKLVGKMHLFGITAKELAEEAGLHPKYLSTVINGHYESKRAEEKICSALDRIIEKKQEGTE